MNDSINLLETLLKQAQERLPSELTSLRLPPPIWHDMQGEMVAFSAEAGRLTARFPLQARYQNPMGYMQGGMIAAAIDNTIGPLSFVVAPPSVTRTMEITYLRPVLPDYAYITVDASLEAQEGEKLLFKAQVRDPQGKLLARGRATHWVISAVRQTAPTDA